VLIAVDVLLYLATASRSGSWQNASPMVLIPCGSNFGPETISGKW
jgi:hypothetical protein